MPRDVNGNYSLPAGNPVVTNTLISSVWANTTLSDVATALSNSLDRTGASSGMTGQLKAADGAIGAPGISFNSEPASGLYRAGAADFRFSVASTDRVTFSANGVGATLVRSGDGAIGGPGFSWTNETSTGWYRAGAGDIRFALGGVDEIRLQSAVATFTAGVLGSNFQPTGSTLPAGNSIYLPAANTIGFSTNGSQRGTINSTGNWSINAPSSGTALTVSGSAALGFLLSSGAPSNSSTEDIRVSRAGSTINTIQQGPNITLFDTTNTTVSCLQQSGGQTELWQFNGSWVGVWKVTSGRDFQFRDPGGTFQPVGYRNIPINQQGANYTLVAADVGKLVNVGGSFTVTVNGGVFASGDSVCVAVGAGATVTLAQGAGMSLQWAGSGGTTGSRTMTGCSMVTLWFANTNVAFLSGAGLS